MIMKKITRLYYTLFMFIVIVACLACCGCASDPHGLRTSHITVTQNTYINGDCAGDLSLATCDMLVKKGINNQKFVMIR